MTIFEGGNERECLPISLKSWPFEASEDSMTKFKSQALHIVRIKY